jgi:taurine---2-oxoglutarate transaminase
MAIETERGSMTGDEMVALTKRHTLFEWSAQSKVDPIPVAGAKGVYFWTPEGKRFLDFNSQLMCTNIGHGHPKVVAAIQEQAETLAYANPFMATEPRARLGAKLAEITPGDIDTFFFTNGGAEANENAIKLARFVTGRHKILARYRSYHGGTAGAISLTGDPRRWAAEPGIPGVVHVLDPYHGIERGWDTADEALANLEETIQLEGPNTIAAFILETVVGTNGILVPPDGYIAGVREICDRYGILMIADEVMAGFGRTGRWFAIDHYDVVPDLITMAKGLTSAYVQLGALGMRRKYAEHFTDKVFYGGLTYNSHPLACATALATIAVYEDEGLIERAARMGELMRTHHEQLAERHPSVGAARNIGLFGVIELVRDRSTMEPMAPFNGTSDEMVALGKRFRADGLYTLVRWNYFFTNPPLVITEEEMAEGFAIIDRALDEVDAAVR